MKFLIIFLFLFQILISTSNSFKLEVKCFEFESTGYRCVSRNFQIISKDDRTVTEVNAVHEEGKTNKDVKDFSSFDENLNFFPLKIAKFFTNLESFKITRGGLKEISGNDLKQFGEKLKKISLEGNEIQKIEKNLFESNKNIEMILMGENKIEKIEKGSFDGLEKLMKLSLEDNPCTSDSDRAMNDRDAVKYLIEEIEEKCKSE